jgi:hypothetical protein
MRSFGRRPKTMTTMTVHQIAIASESRPSTP